MLNPEALHRRQRQKGSGRWRRLRGGGASSRRSCLNQSLVAAAIIITNHAVELLNGVSLKVPEPIEVLSRQLRPFFRTKLIREPALRDGECAKALQQFFFVSFFVCSKNALILFVKTFRRVGHQRPGVLLAKSW